MFVSSKLRTYVGVVIYTAQCIVCRLVPPQMTRAGFLCIFPARFRYSNFIKKHIFKNKQQFTLLGPFTLLDLRMGVSEGRGAAEQSK